MTLSRFFKITFDVFIRLNRFFKYKLFIRFFKYSIYIILLYLLYISIKLLKYYKVCQGK